MSTPVLAIACGPTVTTWDIAKSTTSQETSCFDAKSLAGVGTGVERFQPHGDDIVNCLAWNHNGQVIASCSNSTKSHNPHNVVLTHFSTRTKLESFSNFHTSASMKSTSGSSMDPSQSTPAATSISFGGRSAKSRYLCVSDEGGSASVWDMKKISRVRCFKMKNVDGTSGISSSLNQQQQRPSCVKCCMDPSDSYVVALHGDLGKPSSLLSSRIYKSKHIALELFHLKTGSRVASLKTSDYLHGGGADCFEFSTEDNGQLLVGTRDGSLLLWDCSVTAISANTATNAATSTRGGGNVWGPKSVLEKRHQGPVMDVAFSPMNKVLAASCSADGTVAFHDVNSKKTIQTIRPWDHPIKFMNKSDTGAISNGKGFTSLGFHHDGFTWAAGTENGIVFTYDLRQTNQGPLCTMDVSGGDDYRINELQFLQTRPAAGPKSAVKKTVSLAEDGAVTVEREKTTPLRKEVSKTVYSMQTDQPSAAATGATPSSQSAIGKPVSSRTERIVKKTTTTSKTISSPPRRSTVGGGSTFIPPQPETKVESTSTNEVTTSSSQKPSTTKRITKSKITTSSPQRTAAPSATRKTKEATFDDIYNSSAKKDASVSFDNHKRNIPFNDLTFGNEDNSVGSDSNSDADNMMEDFDKMYERIKSRALRDEKPAHDDSPPEIIRESTVFTKDDSKVEAAGDSNEIVTMTKAEIQEMIEDAVESLRDDMEETIQSLQLDFLKQMQKQSEEVTNLLFNHRQQLQTLASENQTLKSENERLRKQF